MDFTFGIITDGNNNDRLNVIIDSIENENIPNHEIIIVGGNKIDRNIKHVPFDESIKRMWITKKKNLITKNAIYENIVYMHDYIKLNEGWYNGYLEFGNNFNICMNKILDVRGERFRDWCLWCRDMLKFNIPQHEMLIPYDMNHLTRFQYISGAYWVAKKFVMEQNPLQEYLSWGEGEDLEWSMRIRRNYNLSMNIMSSVSLLKERDKVFIECSEETIKKLKNIL
jgi:hypothetical protein